MQFQPLDTNYFSGAQSWSYINWAEYQDTNGLQEILTKQIYIYSVQYAMYIPTKNALYMMPAN